MTTPAPFDARWQEVTCRDCGTTYQCTPENDYYGNTTTAGDGQCQACLMTSEGMDPERTPVLVVGVRADGTLEQDLDPRDLALAAPGAGACPDCGAPVREKWSGTECSAGCGWWFCW